MAEELEQRELREFKGARVILLVAFVMDGQLLASGDAIVRIIDKLVPERGCRFVIATAFSQDREFARGLRADQGRKPGVAGLATDGMSAVCFTAAVQEPGKPKRSRESASPR